CLYYYIFSFTTIATTHIYTLSLHDALPIYAFGRIQFRPVGREREHFHISAVRSEPVRDFRLGVIRGIVLNQVDAVTAAVEGGHRSEEHTSELQSRGHLVCRLLLEKKKERMK